MTNHLLLRLDNFILLILNCFFVPGDLFIHLADYSTSLELRLCWIYKFASLTWFSLVVCRSVSFALILKVKVVNIFWILFLSQIQNTKIFKNVFFSYQSLFHCLHLRFLIVKVPLVFLIRIEINALQEKNCKNFEGYTLCTLQNSCDVFLVTKS